MNKDQIGSRSVRVAGAAVGIALSFLMAAVPVNAQVTEDLKSSERTITNLPLVQWQDPGQAPKGCIVLVHGMSQRGECLSTIGKDFASKGYLVWAVDLRGHGFWRFSQERGSKGYRCDFKRSAEDLVNTIKTIRVDYPDLPTYLIGESCGAATVTKAAVLAPEYVNGMVLCSAGTKPCHYKTTWVLHDLLSNIWRFNHPVNLLRYQQKYGSDLASDFDEHNIDPCERRALSLHEMLQIKNACHGTGKLAKKIDPNIPVLVVQGAEDHTLKPSSAKKVYNRLLTDDKQLVMIPGCGHLILGTKQPKPVIVSSIENWLAKQGSTQVARANIGVDQ